jgi:hypothetical protein
MSMEDRMKEHPDNYDAELMLRLYDLRREEKLRTAREWFTREFHAESYEDFSKRYPIGSQENTYFRMVVSYWDMAGSIVNNGLIKEEFFFETNAEFYAVWIKIKPFAATVREIFKNPHVWKNLESLTDKYEAWMMKRAPGALEATRQRFLQMTAKK